MKDVDIFNAKNNSFWRKFFAKYRCDLARMFANNPPNKNIHLIHWNTVSPSTTCSHQLSVACCRFVTGTSVHDSTTKAALVVAMSLCTSRYTFSPPDRFQIADRTRHLHSAAAFAARTNWIYCSCYVTISQDKGKRGLQPRLKRPLRFDIYVRPDFTSYDGAH